MIEMKKNVRTLPSGVHHSEYLYKMMRSGVRELQLIGNERDLAAVLWEDDRPNRVRVRATKED